MTHIHFFLVQDILLPKSLLYLCLAICEKKSVMKCKFIYTKVKIKSIKFFFQAIIHPVCAKFEKQFIKNWDTAASASVKFSEFDKLRMALALIAACSFELVENALFESSWESASMELVAIAGYLSWRSPPCAPPPSAGGAWKGAPNTRGSSAANTLRLCEGGSLLWACHIH